MKFRNSQLALLIAMLAIGCAARSARLTTNPDTIARELGEGKSLERRSMLVEAAFKIPPEKRTTRLWLALRDELLDTVEERASGASGEASAEHLANLTEIIAQWKDPVAIIPIALVIEHGGIAMHALAAFGEQAAPTVTRIAMLEDTSKAQSALLTLALMMKEMLSLETREKITSIARQRLHGKQGVAVLAGAVRLAVATGDPELRSRVEQLVSDRDELVKCGVTDPDDIHFFLEVAKDALRKQ